MAFSLAEERVIAETEALLLASGRKRALQERLSMAISWAQGQQVTEGLRTALREKLILEITAFWREQSLFLPDEVLQQVRVDVVDGTIYIDLPLEVTTCLTPPSMISGF